MPTLMNYYFDYAAATPLDERVLAHMKPYFTQDFYNPSATYAPAKKVKQVLYESRSTVAKVLGAKPEEIIFTAGGTEANNLAISGVMHRFPDAECVIGALEHDSVRAPARKTGRAHVAPVDELGHVRHAELDEMITGNTVLVSIMYANNEIGTIENLKKIASIIDSIKQKRQSSGNALPLYFHTDACQAANYLKLQVHSLGVDMMTLNGGKIYGPKQSGCLFIGRGVQIDPQILGGGQEYGYRSGTENVAAAVGFAFALKMTQEQRKDESARLLDLQKQAFRDLNALSGDIIFAGSHKNRLPNNIHLMAPGLQNETFLLKLEQKGILAAAGSACSAQKTDTYSHVLEAIGTAEPLARSSIRFTMGRSTDEAAINHLVKAVRDLISGNQ